MGIAGRCLLPTHPRPRPVRPASLCRTAARRCCVAAGLVASATYLVAWRRPAALAHLRSFVATSAIGAAVVLLRRSGRRADRSGSRAHRAAMRDGETQLRLDRDTGHPPLPRACRVAQRHRRPHRGSRAAIRRRLRGDRRRHLGMADRHRFASSGPASSESSSGSRATASRRAPRGGTRASIRTTASASSSVSTL